MAYTKLKKTADIINRTNDWIGRTVCLLVIPMIFILFYEVIMRYAFDSPTVWAHETSGMLYTVYFLLGGAYAMRWNSHIHIEFLYNRLSLRTRAVVDCFTWLFFFLFVGTILWKGIPFAWESVADLERSSSPLAPPVWPVKLIIPISAFMFLLQGLVKVVGSLITAVTGQDPGLISNE